ncbi:MAG: hypothetical protein JSW68_02190, partial [Burkholderiales bacterium]
LNEVGFRDPLPLGDLGSLDVPLAVALGKVERGVMLRGLRRLVATDRQVTVNEWMLLWVVQRRLAPPRPRGWSGPRLRLSACCDQVARVARLLARADGQGEAQAARRTAAVLGALGADPGTVARLASGPAQADAAWLPAGAPLPAVELALEAVDVAVARLAALWPHEKPRLVRALLLADDKVEPSVAAGLPAASPKVHATRARLECLRALCSAIDCPPPAELTELTAAERGMPRAQQQASPATGTANRAAASIEIEC